ncbi:MoaF C-terminal domain-containing protein [uncultured Eubacterium sp.]
MISQETRKLAENLYWFTWIEKVVPTIGTVIFRVYNRRPVFFAQW